MKRIFSFILALLVFIGVMFTPFVTVQSGKTQIKRSIAIVFDNSGSMYVHGEPAWCRATYAMEVFASMLNEGDSLRIHPMNPIAVDGKSYTMDNPFVISDPAQASQIRNIYTESAMDTHIETIDAAVKGFESVQADEKYLIILTDGQVFYEGGRELSTSETERKLSERFNNSVGPNMNILYLGIGSRVAMPTVSSEYYFGEKASDSVNVLSALTMMCNRIFARDTLPESHKNGNTISFDISLSKLIVFVQGENVSDVSVKGENGVTVTRVGSAKTQYSNIGAGNYKNPGESAVDSSLQGMLVTYTNCPKGEYEISYSGNASNVEVYYEPNADLDFIFTDSEGNLVEPNSLYKGDYKVQYGLKDAQTGELISSDLLGNPRYEGKYIINGNEYLISHDGYSGETPVSLNVGDTFSAELTASYLNGYSITKSAQDFGWSDGSLTVSPRPGGDLRIEISGGDKSYNLSRLEEGKKYTAKIFYKDIQLIGDSLKSVELKWEPEKSNAEIKQQFKDDHYELSLHYKNPKDPLSTKCGDCTVSIHAFYTPDGCDETTAAASLTYKIEDKVSIPEVDLKAKQDYFVISDIDEGDTIKAYVTINDKKLSPKEFAALKFDVDCEGIGYTVNPVPEESMYEIKLNSSGVLDSGDYKINATVKMKDKFGREYSSEDSCEIELSKIPLWLKWLIIILAIIILIVLIYFILHIKRLPTNLHTKKNDCEMNVGGANVSSATSFKADLEGKTLKVEAKYAGIKTGISMDVEPGAESYLMTKQVKRKVLVHASTVRKFGGADIEEATVGNSPYNINEESRKLEPSISPAKNFELSNGNSITYAGTIQTDGMPQSFYVRIKLNYRKK